MKASRLIMALGTLCLSPSLVFAQAEIVPEDDIAGAGDKDIVGWNPSLAVSGTINLVNNTNVVGQVEGTSALFGLGLSGGADYIKGPQVWRTTVTINEGFAKTPVVDDFVKTNDELVIESSYNYFLAKKLGFFGQGKIGTTLFNARAITADPQTYNILGADGMGVTDTVTTDNLKVADAFKPFTLGYSAGGFAEPVSRKPITLRVRAGLGGRHTFANDVLVQNDDDTTAEIELQELTNVHQAGVELFAGLVGKAKKDRLQYSAGVSLLMPFVNNDSFDRSATDLTRIAIEATATISVFDWMGLVYKGAIVRDPQLFPDGEELTQVQNSFLLTFNYTLIDRKKGLKELEKKAALEAAEEAKAAAEKRAKELEEREQKLKEEKEQLEKQLEEEKARKAAESGTPATPETPPAPAPAPAPEPAPPGGP